MKRITLTDGWRFEKVQTISVQSLAHGGGGDGGTPVQIPHDAMWLEKRSPDVKGQNQNAFFPGGIYAYTKEIDLTAAAAGGRYYLELEGAYRNSSVYVNGVYAGGYSNGYTEYVLDLGPYLRFGEINQLKIMVNNDAQPSGRWYTGSGLYRPVNLIVSGPVHLEEGETFLKTMQADNHFAQIEIQATLRNDSATREELMMVIECHSPEGKVAVRTELPLMLLPFAEEKIYRVLPIQNPELWSCEHPALYQYSIQLLQGDKELDRETGTFGIRTLALDPSRGFLLNDEAIKLRGACIHHDNGLLGACAFPEAEERRIRQLKEAGFNCVRSAHNPASRAMLDACDRLGMLMMDEYSDTWTIPKNAHDDTASFAEHWQKDLTALVRKDRNHPSVVLYCMGNEIPEAGNPWGAALARRMNSFLKSLDDTRPTVNSTNGLLAGSGQLRAIMGDLLKDRMPASGSAEQQQGGGMDAMNNFMSMLNGPLGDAIMAHPLMTKALDAYDLATDITGLNYMPSRYELELKNHPERLVLGTEEYPADIVRLWGLVRKYPHVIGDMTWTGYDYTGEAGIGIFYYDGTQNFMPRWPDRLAYIGDLDITGRRRPISYLRETVYGLRHVPYIAVLRMDRDTEEASKSAWMYKDNIASWTWPGKEGQLASVEVYSDAEEVELELNGISQGIQPAGEQHGFTAAWEIPYAPGTLTAYAIRNGARTEQWSLFTAENDCILQPIPEGHQLKADGKSLLFIPVELRDRNGVLNPAAQCEVSVKVEGEGRLASFGTADPSPKSQPGDSTWTLWDGRAMAVIQAGENDGKIKAVFSAHGIPEAIVDIAVKK